ncbi:MAG: methyl-accepting chemotaxis protein [Pseudomonadota bacterium]
MTSLSSQSEFDIARSLDLAGLANGQLKDLQQRAYAIAKDDLSHIATEFVNTLGKHASPALPGNTREVAEASFAALLESADRSQWTATTERLGQIIAGANLDVTSFALANAAAWQAITAIARSAEGVSQAQADALCGVINSLAVLHSSAVSAAIATIGSQDARSNQRENADMFEMDISSTAHIIADQTAMLADEMEIGADLADGVLAKTDEVSAASQQSVDTMREAAKTTNSLMHGVQKAREEIAVAAQSAKRASQEAKESAGSMKMLEEQSKSIGSILNLIGEIAEQTNVLALNATIEAARAGDAGLGFAVVAREVKSLADQTATATKEVAESVNSIREAAELSVASNASICEKVDQVQEISVDITEALENQARFVSHITETVDENVSSAERVSEAIANIREDTNSVVVRINSLKSGFSQVDKNMEALRENAEKFVQTLT